MIDCVNKDQRAYQREESTVMTTDQKDGKSGAVRDATKAKTKRARSLLNSGEKAEGGDWVMVFIMDLYGGREEELGGRVAPVQLWGSGKWKEI